MLFDPALQSLQRATATWLSRPDPSRVGRCLTEPARLGPLLRPGDVLLVDGDTRFAQIVKLLSGSTWTHVALYVGQSELGAPIIEADVQEGVRLVKLDYFRTCRLRILRALGLPDAARAAVARSVTARLGHGYDLSHALRLARERLPLGRRAASLAVHPQKTICSTLIAEAYEAAGVRLFPDADWHWTRSTPRDFASSRAFETVEPGAHPAH